ncbi:MAG TPA: hypothetical protein VLG50_03215 [Candidatus Saccharimonadales bacterium]|nr:hypothetical protein [Candidatus Saccharimonadales bacterium]
MDWFDNEAEKMFLDQIYEQKKAAASLKTALKFKRPGKNLMFPSDLMNRKEKLKHTKAGKVMTTNLFDEIVTLEAFKELEETEQKNRMQYWRSKYTIAQIQKGMKIAQGTFYKIIDELGLPKDRAANGKGKPRAPRTSKAVAVITRNEAMIETPKEVEAAAPIQEIMRNGLNLTFNGAYDAEMIQKQLLKILTLLDEEDDQYYVEFKLMQKIKKGKADAQS